MEGWDSLGCAHQPLSVSMLPPGYTISKIGKLIKLGYPDWPEGHSLAPQFTV